MVQRLTVSGNRACKLFAAVVLAALDDAIVDDKKYGNGPEQIARWHAQEMAKCFMRALTQMNVLLKV